MALPQEVQDALSRVHLMVDSESEWADIDIADWQTIHAHLLSQDAELKILRVKCSGTLANNLCPDHRDKQVGNPCLACTIEKLQSRLADERIDAHLLSQDDELADYKNASLHAADDCVAKDAEIARLQSRLAVDDALLSRCFVQIGELTKGLAPHDPIYVELQQLGLDWMQHSEADTAHLSENTHDRA